MSNAEHVQDLVRAHDRDRFLSSLFAPDDRRPSLLALYAFNVEVGRIAASVSEPQLGLIRQQWWLDTLDAIFGGSDVPAHPVAQELARAVEQGGLPKHALRNLVLAREFDLYCDPMPDMQALETYLGETSSALIQMASLVLVGPLAVQCAEAAGLAGVAHGLALLLNAGDSGHLPPDLTPVAAQAHARRRLQEARALSGRLPTDALPAFLPVTLTEMYLAAAWRSRPPLAVRRQYAIWWAARNNRF